jgi:alpha-1,3-mannosyl-glycoprotein beta-1,2-N-acetylglucosaminyltransferase
MMTRRLWQELGPKWPKAFWDDWMRLKDVRKGRQTIFPEVCRNYNFGEHVSCSQKFSKLGKFMCSLLTLFQFWQKLDE